MNQSSFVQSDKIFINPGAVGQPRWGRLTNWGLSELHSGYPRKYVGAPEASYVWLEILPDAVQLWCHYVPYDYDATVRKLDGLVPALEVPARWKLRLTEGLR
jgi:hypothetical protein